MWKPPTCWKKAFHYLKYKYKVGNKVLSNHSYKTAANSFFVLLQNNRGDKTPLIIPDSSCPPQDRRVCCCCPNIYVFIPYTVGAPTTVFYMYSDRRLWWLFSRLIVLTHKTNGYTTHQLHTPNTFNVKSLTFQTRHHSQNFPLFLSNHLPRAATSFLIGSCGTFCNQWKKSVCFSLEGFSPRVWNLLASADLRKSSYKSKIQKEKWILLFF